MLELSASVVSVVEEDDVLDVAFGDDVSSPTHWLILQRSLRPTVQDARLGHDRAHVSWHNDATGEYADVRVVSLTLDRLELEILAVDGPAGGVTDVCIALGAARFDLATLADAL